MTVASSGNAGASVAAYAARAGLRAVILTSRSAPAPMRALMGAYGALMLAPDDAPTAASSCASASSATAGSPFRTPRPAGRGEPVRAGGLQGTRLRDLRAARLARSRRGRLPDHEWRHARRRVARVPRPAGARRDRPGAAAVRRRGVRTAPAHARRGRDVPRRSSRRSRRSRSPPRRASALQVLRAVRETGGWSLAVEGDESSWPPGTRSGGGGHLRRGVGRAADGGARASARRRHVAADARSSSSALPAASRTSTSPSASRARSRASSRPRPGSSRRWRATTTDDAHGGHDEDRRIAAHLQGGPEPPPAVL